MMAVSDDIESEMKDRGIKRAIDLVEECCGPLTNYQGSAALAHRTNRLLGAILLKLHGVDQ
jgi:hypothetical protein